MFFGSAVNNFGVMEVLDALVDLAPAPQARKSTAIVNRQPVERMVEPDDTAFSGVVFKVQANMDPRTATASPSCAWLPASSRRA